MKSPTGRGEMVGVEQETPTRHKISNDTSSLGSLSRRFMEFVETRVDGVIDLNETAQRLNAHKRRVYDITNVLEGVDLLEKISKNNVRWTPPSRTELSEQESKAAALERHIRFLEESLRVTDEKIAAVYANLRALQGDAGAAQLFIRKSDILSIPRLKKQRCFAIHATEDAQFHTKTNSKRRQCLVVECTRGDLKFIDLTKDDLCNGAPVQRSESEEGCKENQS